IDSVVSVIDKLLMILICSILLFSPRFKPHFVIEWFVYAQIVAYFVTIILAILITTKRYTQIRMQHFSVAEMMRLCKVSLPYALLILLMGIYMRSDSLLLERLQGAAENGIYAQAYRILDAANTFGLLFAGMLLSMFSRIISKKLPVGDLVKTSANILMPVSLACVAFGLVYAQDIMYFFYNDSSREGSQIFMLVFACFPAFSLMYIYSTLLTANGSIKLLIKIALLGCVLSIGTNFVLIPLFHAKGAAMSAFLVEWVLALLFILFSHRTFELPSSARWVLQFTFFFALLLAANWGLKLVGVSFLMASAANLLLFVVISYSVGLWNRNLIESYIRQYKSNS
ncbi:MAG TPA: polysaccharide biosynthesis C-terminal domain-containing protein, partial [Chitinophagaceae bacterium]|nr:polysaccharide biosynthesis C-terminal domain-containing protein [Chitinophagaceae bacterium]